MSQLAKVGCRTESRLEVESKCFFYGGDVSSDRLRNDGKDEERGAHRSTSSGRIDDHRTILARIVGWQPGKKTASSLTYFRAVSLTVGLRHPQLISGIVTLTFAGMRRRV